MTNEETRNITNSKRVLSQAHQFKFSFNCTSLPEPDNNAFCPGFLLISKYMNQYFCFHLSLCCVSMTSFWIWGHIAWTNIVCFHSIYRQWHTWLKSDKNIYLDLRQYHSKCVPKNSMLDDSRISGIVEMTKDMKCLLHFIFIDTHLDHGWGHLI